MRALTRTVLKGKALVVAGLRHPVVRAKLCVAPRLVVLGIGIQIAEGPRQTVAAMVRRRAAKEPESVL